MRILFLGTPEFAVPALEALIDGPDEVVAVVTQPDRPKGRGLTVEPGPVARRAIQAGIPVLQPERLHDAEGLARFRALSLDLAVTCAFGRLLRSSFLEIPRVGSLNVHASLLPRHRGASPVPRAILDQDPWTGITIFRLDEGMDTGPILLQMMERILPDDTAGSLGERLSRLGGVALREALSRIRMGTARFVPQDAEGVTLAPLLQKEDGAIPWNRPADQIECFVRAMAPWPGAVTRIGELPLRIHALDPLDLIPAEAESGTILLLEPSVIVAAMPGRVRLRRVQPAGRRAIPAEDWARGARLSVGDRFS